MTGEAGNIRAADSPVGPEEAVVAEIVALTAERIPRLGEDQPLLVAVVEVTGDALPAPEGGVDAPRALSDVVRIVTVLTGIGGRRDAGGENEGAAEEQKSGKGARFRQSPDYC